MYEEFRFNKIRIVRGAVTIYSYTSFLFLQPITNLHPLVSSELELTS